VDEKLLDTGAEKKQIRWQRWFAQSPIRRGTASRSQISMSTQPHRIPTASDYARCGKHPSTLHPKTVLRKVSWGLASPASGTDRKRWHFLLSSRDRLARSQVISGSHPRRQPKEITLA